MKEKIKKNMITLRTFNDFNLLKRDSFSEYIFKNREIK